MQQKDLHQLQDQEKNSSILSTIIHHLVQIISRGLGWPEDYRNSENFSVALIDFRLTSSDRKFEIGFPITAGGETLDPVVMMPTPTTKTLPMMTMTRTMTTTVTIPMPTMGTAKEGTRSPKGIGAHKRRLQVTEFLRCWEARGSAIRFLFIKLFRSFFTLDTKMILMPRGKMRYWTWRKAIPGYTL